MGENSENQAGSFRDTHENVHILQGGAGGPFSEIVKACREHNALISACDGDLQIVPSGEGGGREEAGFIRIGIGVNNRAWIERPVQVQQVGGRPFQLGGVQTDDDLHSGIEIASVLFSWASLKGAPPLGEIDL